MSMALTRVFLFSALGLVLGLASFMGPQALAAPTGSEYTEKMLATRAYDIPPDQPVLEWLETLVQKTLQDTQTRPGQAAINHVILGDAYHWIGHIYEERRQFEFAWQNHMLSFQHYTASPLRSSAFITNLNTVEHARLHLSQMAPRVQRPLPPEVKSFIRSSDIPPSPLDDLSFYKTAVRGIFHQAPQCASLFF